MRQDRTWIRWRQDSRTRQGGKGRVCLRESSTQIQEGCVMRWLRERSSTYSRRQPKGAARWGDVSGGGRQWRGSTQGGSGHKAAIPGGPRVPKQK
jgi:hypothetical protein